VERPRRGGGVKYRTIVADPPWQYGANRKHPTSAEAQYATLTMDEVAALPIDGMAEDDAHLYVWVTNPILTEQRITGPNICAVVRGWGFEPKTILTWIKGENGAGMGFYFRGDTEHVLFAVKGELPIAAEHRVSNVFRGQRGKHSAKPDSFLDVVEQVSPGPYLELFARRARFGWDYWGDESLNTAQVPA
jgi:N6-adenosine-specific RNA methylase IME4